MKSTIVTLSLLFAFTTANAQSVAKARVHLGPNINTANSIESHPVLSPNGKSLFFSRGTLGATHVFRSELNGMNEWGNAVEIPEFDIRGVGEVDYVFPDGNRVVLSGHYRDTDGVFVSDYNGTTWTEPTPIQFEHTIAKWFSPNATFSTNGKVMILSNNTKLSASFLRSNGIWSDPVAIPELNAGLLSYTPFLAADDRTLYFSANGYGTLGGNDIVRTTRLDDSWLKWSRPEDLDNTINSPDWESYFYMSAAGDDAYVYSRAVGNGDIYRVTIAAKARPNPVALITGTVINAKTKEPLAAEITYDDIESNQNAGVAKTNAHDGKYNVVLHYGKKYSLAARAEHFYALSDVLDLTTVSTYQEISKDILMMPMEVGETIGLHNLFFETNKAELQPASFTELDRLVGIVHSNPSLRIQIGGHTDNVGSSDHNYTLSLARVNAVIAYLTRKGIPSNQLTGKGYGQTKPVTTNATEEGRAQNRRVEFTILAL
ncbi:MAG: OmpA family protein [Bacteroidota bacterium]|nr:OmpA family protein [Bacteroidota bacterium]MDP4232632.1 OmpA family protein [Bacteroidota bacterium]MDP4243884.1 OmpA family protein [Bacteroidota bacterium]MDP4289292.1 OmpA family protein [Bacteroidota bacterium]